MGSPDWYEDLRQKVLGAFPIVDGEVHSPLDELRKKTAGRNRMALSAPAGMTAQSREARAAVSFSLGAADGLRESGDLRFEV